MVVALLTAALGVLGVVLFHDGAVTADVGVLVIGVVTAASGVAFVILVLNASVAADVVVPVNVV